jgi:hypothetical protein
MRTMKRNWRSRIGVPLAMIGPAALVTLGALAPQPANAATPVYTGYGYQSPLASPVCNAVLTGAGYYTGNGSVYMGSNFLGGDYAGTPGMWGPAGTVVSYTPMLEEWTGSTYKVDASLDEIAATVRVTGSSPVLAPEAKHFDISDGRGYYRVAIWYRWYQGGKLVKSIVDWAGGDREQYWDSTGKVLSPFGLQKVPYCTF